MINPVGLTLPEWADAVILSLDISWPMGRLDAGDDWQTWAAGFVRAPDIAQRALPDPYQFDDWRDWAERAAPMLEVA